MRLLLDQGLPRVTASLLQLAGYDAFHVGDVGYGNADDAEILAYARAENRVVVTLDADFHGLLALSASTAPSVIRIRIDIERSSAKHLRAMRGRPRVRGCRERPAGKHSGASFAILRVIFAV